MNDLAIFEQTLYMSLQGQQQANDIEGRHFFVHLSPFLYILLLPYWLAPGAKTLLIATVVMVTVAAGIFYWFALIRLKDPWLALLLSISFLVYPATQGLALSNFHDLVFCLPFLLLLFVFQSRQKMLLLLAALIAALSVREDVALTTFMLSLYWLLQKESRRAGLIVAATSIVWFVVAVYVVMPFLQNQHSWVSPEGGVYAWRYREFGGSIGEILKTMAIRPVFTLTRIFETTDKMAYLPQLFFPLLILLPLGRQLPRLLLILLMALPTVVMNSLSVYFAQQSLVSHYQVAVIAAVALLLVEGLRRFEGNKHQAALALLGLMIVGNLVAGLVYPAIYDPYLAISKNYSLHYPPFSEDDLEILQNIEGFILEEDSIVAAYSIASHYGGRKRIKHRDFRTVTAINGYDFILLDTASYLRIRERWEGEFSQFVDDQYRPIHEFEGKRMSSQRVKIFFRKDLVRR
ncbi:MAG: DUF2079 domain-containing protein [Candidatus Alcyoniella australis]|nr:DUF2079 domain-containing protein [Candidatus Alcyoniella australis]